MKVDLKDKKILYELDINSRETLKKLGRKIGLSQQAVENRINNLTKKKIINSFQTIIAYHKLGYTTYIIYLTFQNASVKNEEEIILKLKENLETIAVWRTEGIYDLVMGIQTKTIFELNNFLIKINKNFGKFIKGYDIVTNIGSEHYPRNYLINKKENKKLFKTGGKEEKIKLDIKDIKILKRLIQNPRISFVDLTSISKLSIDIVRYRFKKLMETQVLQGFSIVLNQGVFDSLNFRVLFKLKNITELARKKILEFANHNQNIRMITQSFGIYELAIDIEVETHEQFRKILSNFRNEFNDYIHHYDILNIYSIEKYITSVL